MVNQLDKILNNLLRYSEYQPINEEFSLANLKAIRGISRVLLDPFTIKLIPDILKLANSDLKDENSWMPAYKNIFRKACVKFGGANKKNVSKTCRKDMALQKMLEYYFDPEKGKFSAKQVKEWVDFTTKGRDPKTVRYQTTPIMIDEAVMKLVEILKRTGLNPASIRNSGTYALNIAIPVMKRFYPIDTLKNLKMFKNNILMNTEEVKKLLSPDSTEQVEEPTKPGGKIEF